MYLCSLNRISSYFYPPSSASPVDSEDMRARTAALRSLGQLGAALVLNGVAKAYVVKDIRFLTSAMFSVTLFQYGLTLLSVYIVGTAALRTYRGEGAPQDMLWRAIEEVMKGKLGMLPALSLANFFQLAYPHFFIHEAGHALAALSCFQNAHPKMTIRPFRGGETAYAISWGMTSFGKWLGKQNALMLVDSAGFLASLSASFGESALAHFLQDSFPAFSRFLESCGQIHLLHEFLYGLQALKSPSPPYHDLFSLWQEGEIHPALFLTLFAAFPLWTKWIFARKDSTLSK